MSEITPRDILLRIGGATLKRHGVLASSGAGRGVEVPYTHTRAASGTFTDRDGVIRKAGTNVLRPEFFDGDADGIRESPGIRLTGTAGFQLVTNPENFSLWTAVNSPTVTGGQTDPFGGTAAYVITDDNGAANERIEQTVTFTGNGTKAMVAFLRAGTAATTELELVGAAVRVRVLVTWTAGVPALSITVGGGSATATSVGNGWYFIEWTANSVVAADTNLYRLNPAGQSAGTGTVFFFGANAWNTALPWSYQSAVDSLTSPYNWGPSADITVLVRLLRPLHNDMSGALGLSPGIFSFGAGAAARIGAYFDPAARNIISAIDTATTDATQTTPIPAGNPTICIQYRNLTTGGQTRIDAGSGFTAWSSAATPFSAFSSQTMRVGRYDDELYGVVGDILTVRGVDFTRAEVMAVP